MTAAGWAFTAGIIASNADLGMVGNEGRENGKGKWKGKMERENVKCELRYGQNVWKSLEGEG